MNVPILIPAYNPDHHLVEVVDRLIALGVDDIVIVDDGSKDESRSVFRQLAEKQQCHILTHAVNCGKGRALKTGFNYVHLHFPNRCGVVTADADGQHNPQDILKVAETLSRNPNHFIMGVRKMKKDIPFRSLLGNTLTRWVFSLMIGKSVSDTQTGLRGIPGTVVPQLLTVSGERYEYEINMLIHTREKNIGIIETPIDTIYIQGNQSSHFNPLLDSMRIYFQLLRFTFSSLLTAGFDFLVFTLVFHLSGNIMLSLLTGRFVVGSLVNFVINRRLVFHSTAGVLPSLLKYYFALLVMSLFSYLLIGFTVDYFGTRVVYAKVMVESVLFFFSFMIQREFVFASRMDDNS